MKWRQSTDNPSNKSYCKKKEMMISGEEQEQEYQGDKGCLPDSSYSPKIEGS